MEAENQQEDLSSPKQTTAATEVSAQNGGNGGQTDDKPEEASTKNTNAGHENKGDNNAVVDNKNVSDKKSKDVEASDGEVTKPARSNVSGALSEPELEILKDRNSSKDNITSPQSPTASRDQDLEPKSVAEVQNTALTDSSPQPVPMSEQSVDKNKLNDNPIKETTGEDNSSATAASLKASSSAPATLPPTSETPTKQDENELSNDAVGSPNTNGFSPSSVDGVARLEVTNVDDDDGGVGGEAGGNGEVVVVTGGSGFLGQHVVKMLQTRAPHVSEIRVLDVREFEQRLDYTATKPVRSVVGSVGDSQAVSQALRGAHSVIHVAGLISWGTFPDLAGMEETNVIGTVNVFNACLKNNVRRLLYCSTVDVAVGSQPILGGDEETTPVPPPDGFMFPGYPETKYQGERVVLNSARVLRQDGENLQTVILRANVLYGELDTSYVINGLRNAYQSKGILRQIGDGMAMFQQSYAGNTAWAFVRADQAMRENPELTAQVFYVPDNTPVQNSFNFMRPYLEERGFRLSESRLSYALVHSAVRVAEVLARGFSPIYRFNLPVQSYSVQYINTSIYFSGEKARRVLGYEPIFTPYEARQACLDYYKTVDLS